MLEQSTFNLLIRNIPKIGCNKYTNESEPITAKVIHDTMHEFANVRDAVVFDNNAYIEFDDHNSAILVHKLIDNMAIEKNIISTHLCKHVRISL